MAEKKLCDARGMEMSIRMNCMLEKGHVKTIDDWHWASADMSSETTTNTYKQSSRVHEEHSWRPNLFELPSEAREAALDALGPVITSHDGD